VLVIDPCILILPGRTIGSGVSETPLILSSTPPHWSQEKLRGWVSRRAPKAKDKKRYEAEIKNYVPPDDDSSEDEKPKKRARKSKKEKDPHAPKRPVNAYMEYAKAERETVRKENPKMQPKEIVSELGARWKKMSDSEKKPYVERMEKAKALYEKELKTYKPSK